jgi:hypothetical protein
VNVRNSGTSLLCVHDSRLQRGVYKNQAPLKMERTKTICPIPLFFLFVQTMTTKTDPIPLRLEFQRITAQQTQIRLRLSCSLYMNNTVLLKN